MRSLALAARRVEGLSGAVRLILAEAAAAAAAGWRVAVLAEKIDREAVRAAGAEAIRIPAWPWGSWLKRRAFAALAARRVGAFDLVHGHGDLLAQDVLSLHNCVHAAREAATGARLSADDAVGRIHALQLSERCFRLMVANSNLMRDDVIRRFDVPADRIEVIYPGYDPDVFKIAPDSAARVARRRAWGVGGEEVVVGLVTSGDFEKRGVAEFLRGFAAAAQPARNIRAIVVGKEARPAPYRRLVADLNIADRVTFLEPVRDVADIYRALDISVHAARWEEFGMTVLEASACGVPVVAARRTGATEIFRGESREFVIDAPTPGALAEAIQRLASDPDRRRRLAELGIRAAAPYTLAAHGRAVAEVYERLSKK